MEENEFIPWLLGAPSPSIRYQTMTDLLGYPVDEPRLVQVRQEIMTGGAVPAILGRQSENGQWNGERSFYTPKYTSSHWSMLLLTECSLDGTEARFRQGTRHMLETTAGDLDKRLETGTPGWACFWGNLLRYALHAGMAEEARVERLIHYLALNLQDGPCRCRHNGGNACAWGAARALWGLAAIPKATRTPELEGAIAPGVQFLIDSLRLVDANYPTEGYEDVSPIWFRLNFPLFYQADCLFSLRVLDEVDMLDQPSARTALAWLEQRRRPNGRWSGSSPYRHRAWPELGDREETNRWVSLQASRILQHAGRRLYSG